MKKIGITGANGHVGANLVRRLLKEDFHIRVLQYHDHEAFDGLPVEVVKGDLNDPASLLPFCEGLDVLIHLAARISIGNHSFDALYKTNVKGTQNLVAAAKSAGVRRYIHFSSIHALVHEPLDKPMDESRELALHSEMPYERTKSIAEEWVLGQQSDNFDVIVLNPTAIIGPMDYKPSLVGQMILLICNGKLPGLVPGGYDWVDVRDISDAVCNAIERAKGGERYILSGTWKSVVEFAGMLGDVCGKKFNIPVLPMWVAKIGVPFIGAAALMKNRQPLYTFKSLKILQTGNSHISNEKARRELGFNPRPLNETLTDAVAWYKEAGKIS